LYGFFKKKRLQKSGLLLSHIEFTKGYEYDNISLFIYDGPYQEYMLNDFKKSVNRGLFLKTISNDFLRSALALISVLKKKIRKLKKIKRYMKKFSYFFIKTTFYLLLNLNLKKKFKDIFYLLKPLTKRKKRVRYLNFFFKFFFKKILLKQKYSNLIAYLKLSLDKLMSKNIILSFFYIGNNGITAELLARYISYKMAKGHTINSLFRPIKIELLKVKDLNRFFYGFKIRLSGRFERRNRARVYSLYEQTLPLSTVVAPIDYYYSTVILKNSICSIKV
jgi:hypothetical protein